MTDTFINNNISHISSTQQTDGGRNNLFCIQVLTLLGNKIPLRLACTLLYSTLPLMSHVDKNGNPWKWKSNVSRKTNEQQKEVVQKYSQQTIFLRKYILISCKQYIVGRSMRQNIRFEQHQQVMRSERDRNFCEIFVYFPIEENI